MNDMKKNIKVIGYGLLVMVALLVSAPVTTQAQNFQSTSTMRGAGSTFTPQVTEVGATGAVSEATTTESYSPAKAPNGSRRIGNFDNIPEGGTQENSSPIGDAVVPLLALACVYMVYSVAHVYRRKRRV